MIRRSVFVAVVVLLGGMMSCTTDDISCERVSSEIVTGKKDLTGFDGIISTAVADVLITQGKDFQFVMQGPENVVEALTAEIVGSDLLISSTKCFNGFTGDNRLIIKITAPSFRKVEMSGTGDMKSANTLMGKNIEIAFLGVGTLSVDMEMDSAYTETAGSGTVKLTGIVGKHDLLQAGEVAVNASGLVTDTTRIVQRSTEDTHIFANEFLKISLEGSGNVFFKGYPVVDDTITGTGEVVDAN